jgi:hypothetical protein
MAVQLHLFGTTEDAVLPRGADMWACSWRHRHQPALPAYRKTGVYAVPVGLLMTTLLLVASPAGGRAANEALRRRPAGNR